MVSWTPPTTNVDGSALTDLTGYRIYHGTYMTSLSDMLEVTNAGLTSVLIEGLTSSTWFFAVSAVSAEHGESERSAIISKTIE